MTAENRTIRWPAILLLCLWASPAFSAPIYSNLGHDLIVDTPPESIEFWSEEPFRVGAFSADVFDGLPIMSHPWQPFELWHDGQYFRAKWTPWAYECKAVQVDADSHDFAGIGRLIDYTAQPCFPTSEEEGGGSDDDGSTVPEPGLLVLLALGFGLSRRPRWYWHRRVTVPVTFHLHTVVQFRWTHICGVQVGPWFIGAVRGEEADPQS